jgi:hypothetical protein
MEGRGGGASGGATELSFILLLLAMLAWFAENWYGMLITKRSSE